MGVSFGSSDSENESYSSSNTTTYESNLSKEQLSILKQRQQQYNDFFYPQIQKALTEGLQSSTVGSTAFNAGLETSAQQINSAFDSAQRGTSQSLAQQGISGNGSGVAASLRAQNERARASALANAYNAQVTAADASKQKYAELLATAGAALSPQPTTSAQYHQVSKSTSTSEGNSGGWNHGVGLFNNG